MCYVTLKHVSRDSKVEKILVLDCSSFKIDPKKDDTLDHVLKAHVTFFLFFVFPPTYYLTYQQDWWLS